ncbi:hypothetical protein B1C78_13090 [Thioalkalivibrio denitrificans]|uniref:AB hydrolase-1 domain-containing protein n=1 Tax=Thioalkalivibrio denitrificans TaxID=108003 RepID=A0A1V3ND60_9GAMM|nr:alpha/beta fold hydrolase [Thioalkalivibrio denitrificans]OOG22985.1 hypothetical protein B1C78_13090 [Thioalkalivibrio denitrificans]
MREGILALRNGRTLTFTVNGTDDGHPVVYLHGIPGSRREPMLPADADLRLRVIALDRPGYGGSSPCTAYGFHQHANDLAALTDHLNIDRFSLFGFSGGGVFALACAAALGSRVEHVVVAGTPAIGLKNDLLNAAGDLTKGVWRMALEAPAALPEALAPLAVDTDTLVRTMLDGLSTVDRDLLRTDGIREHYAANMACAVQQGAERSAAAMARDVRLTVQPWGFDPAVLTQSVHVFHGADDPLVHVSHARVLASAIADARLEVRAGCGHYAAISGAPGAKLWRRVLPV